MEMNDETWHLVRSVPRVMGFIGGTADKPAPISQREADRILNRLQESSENLATEKNSSLVKKFVSLKDHSLTLMVQWKKWIMKRSLKSVCFYLWSCNTC